MIALGRTPVLPGNAVASSMIAPALLAWWLWPVSSATRVGLHSAVVWKRLYRSPPFASFSSVGMLIGPPNALLWPKPMSSISTITTLGAPCGRLHLEARRRLGVARVERRDRSRLGQVHREHRPVQATWFGGGSGWRGRIGLTAAGQETGEDNTADDLESHEPGILVDLGPTIIPDAAPMLHPGQLRAIMRTPSLSW